MCVVSSVTLSPWLVSEPLQYLPALGLGGVPITASPEPALACHTPHTLAVLALLTPMLITAQARLECPKPAQALPLGQNQGRGGGREGSPVHGNRGRRGGRQEGPCTWDRGSGTIKLPGSCEYFDLSVGLALIDIHIFIQSFAGGASGEKPAC